MARILVVHHDVDIADQEVDSLRRAGYDVVECIGPTAAGQPCPAFRDQTCSLADDADVLLYDAMASGATDDGGLIEHLRAVYPDKPIVLTASGLGPAWAEGAGLAVIIGAPDRARLVAAVQAALLQTA